MFRYACCLAVLILISATWGERLAVVDETGYITVNPSQNAQLFYWMVESERNPARDPVVFWLSGGYSAFSHFPNLNKLVSNLISLNI